MLKAKNFRDQSVEELEATYRDACKELYHLVNEFKLTKKVEKPHVIPQKRKEIARLLTVIHEKKQFKNNQSV